MTLNPLLLAILAPLFAGVFGLLGAWLNSRFTTRRERWTFKRDIYARLLEHLHEAECLLRTWMRYPDANKEDVLWIALGKEVEQVRRAYAVGNLVLHPAAGAAIVNIERVWEEIRAGQGTAAEAIRARIDALAAAYGAVLAAGRVDLRLYPGARRWRWIPWRRDPHSQSTV